MLCRTPMKNPKGGTDMKKLSRLLPLVILLLVVAYFLLPAQNHNAAPVSQTAVPEQIELLTAEAPAENAEPEEALPLETAAASEEPASGDEPAEEELLPENGSYTSKEDVALYIHQYGRLPANFVTKAEAKKTGWTGGGLEKYLPGKCIGGDRFGNREGHLPSAEGRTWTECDINTLGKKSRGSERIVFSNDGLIYYTDDHYDSFTQLYG